MASREIDRSIPKILSDPTPELTDAYNAANEAISVTYGTREPMRLVTRWRSRTVAKVDSIRWRRVA